MDKPLIDNSNLSNKIYFILVQTAFTMSRQDIERALSNNYPDDLKHKLITRRINAEKMLMVSKPPKRYHQDIPEIVAAEKHPTIASANDCIKIETNEEFGRHVVATRDIKIGEIICVEKPYVCVLINDELIHCHACLELCYNPIPCDNCVFLGFCSEYCKNQARDTFHKYECSAFAFLVDCGVYSCDLAATRVAVLARERNASELAQEEIYRSDRYKEISNLMKGPNKLEELHRLSITAALIYHGFLSRTAVFDHPDNHIMKNQFKENILSHLLIVNVNKISICENITRLLEQEQQVLAHGLYSFTSLFNHSCCPNVDSTQYGSTTVLRTINTIKKGQQCFISYGAVYWNRSRIERFSLLKKFHFFECKCVACAKNWEAPKNKTDLQISTFLGISEMDFTTMFVQLTAGNDKVAIQYLPLFIHKWKESEQLEPCDQVLEIRVLISYSYKILGNKRLL